MTDKLKNKKKSANNKDIEAINKVNKLLEENGLINLTTDKNEDNIEIEKDNTLDVDTIKKEKSIVWMQKQIDELSNLVEKLESELKESKTNNNNNVADNNTIDNRVLLLYKHFERIYDELGYTDIKFAYPQTGEGVLDKFIEFFPELSMYRRYRYRG
jgi:hypothetical protein